MTKSNIIRAWKDQEFRLSLSAAERALLPEHPAGLIELTDAALDGAGGGNSFNCTVAWCYGPTHIATCHTGVCICQP